MKEIDERDYGIFILGFACMALLVSISVFSGVLYWSSVIPANVANILKYYSIAIDVIFIIIGIYLIKKKK